MAAMGLQRTEVTCKSMTLEARTLRGAPMGKYPIHTLAQCSMHAEQLLNRGQGGLLVKIDVGHQLCGCGFIGPNNWLRLKCHSRYFHRRRRSSPPGDRTLPTNAGKRRRMSTAFSKAPRR